MNEIFARMPMRERGDHGRKKDDGRGVSPVVGLPEFKYDRGRGKTFKDIIFGSCGWL